MATSLTSPSLPGRSGSLSKDRSSLIGQHGRQPTAVEPRALERKTRSLLLREEARGLNLLIGVALDALLALLRVDLVRPARYVEPGDLAPTSSY